MLLPRAISMIAEIFVLISHLLRLLSMFERMSIFFDRKMNVISDPNEMISKHATNCGGAPFLLIYQRKFHVIIVT